ncbi:MAG: response regulator [Deltaproteobacteria bacterium]|nr:response regulator [Deltaproteobacteria bacterium]
MSRLLRKIWTTSIRRQLILGIALVHAVLMTIFVADLVRRQSDFLRVQSIRQTLGLAQTLAANSVSWVLANDVVGLEEVINSQSQFPDLHYAMILDPEGKVLAHSQPDRNGLYVDDPISRLLLDADPEPRQLIVNDSLIDIAAPIQANSHLIGWARIGISQKSISASLRDILKDGIWYTVLAIVVGSIFAFFMAKGITRGLQHLVVVADRIRQGDEKTRAALNRYDELGQLGKILNLMLDTIAAQKNILASAHKELADSVIQLEETNHRLNREIDNSQAMERSLAAEKERLRVTLRSITSGVITTDTEGRVDLVNKVAEQLTGWSQESALGKPLSEIFKAGQKNGAGASPSQAVQPQSGKDLVEKIMRLEQKDLLREGFLISRDGSFKAISAGSAPILDGEGRVYGAVVVFRDMREENMMREQVIKAEKLGSVGVLAGGIAHDFNNILTGILGNINLAKMYVEADSQALALLDEAEKASFRARDLTRQLLTFAKGGEPVRKNAAMAEIIHEVTDFALSGSAVKCHYTIAEDLAYAYIDPGQIAQVIQNIVINAVHAMPGGGSLAISCENFHKGQDNRLPLVAGEYLKLEIRDSGPGIPAEHLPHIFDPYFTTKQKGSGLGLAICHSIISKHGGCITAQSEPGCGATLTVYLPAAPKSEVTVKSRKNALLSGSGPVLIMDDEVLVRNVAARMLTAAGYNVLEAGDGEEAVAVFQHSLSSDKPIDLTLMDLTVPGGMGGEEAVRHILALNPRARVVVCSGYANDPIVAHYADYGFKGVVSKPFSINELLGEVRRVLQQG